MKKRVKGICTLLLAGALAATLLPGLPSARAAVAVNTSKTDCQLEISVGSNIGTSYKDLVELQDKEVDVKIYKVADVNASGSYTSTGAFQSMTFGYIENSDTSASEWNELAEQAAEIAANVEADKTLVIPAGQTSATQTGLGVGLYLLVPQTLTTDYFTYTFDPSLVSLPNNYYYDETKDIGDKWVYELVGDYAITLKPEQTERLGSVKITKDLNGWVATAGSETTFVFEITYTTPKDTETTVTLQEALTFTGSGNDDVTITDIPAGATVTVKEIYTGAAYVLKSVTDSDGTNDGVVTVEAEKTAETTFTNGVGNTPNGGSGVVNHFEKKVDGENSYYDWTTQDSTDGGSVNSRTPQPKTDTAQAQ